MRSGGAIPSDIEAFRALPVTHVSGSAASHRLAVHVSGRFTTGLPPLICVGGFTRNMADFTDFIAQYRASASVDWPIVLVDLAGRGRSVFAGSHDAYSAVTDALDLAMVARALGITRAIFLGMEHGGQVVMAMGAQHPALIAGAVLINAGPATNPQGLVRLRSNLRHLETLRGDEQIRQAMRKILAVDYPGLPVETLDLLAGRAHFIDRKGRARTLFDPALVKFLDRFGVDNDFEPQWPLFDALSAMPMMLVRTELTDRLDPATFEEMCNRRRDAAVAEFSAEGSPALLNTESEVGAIADFVMDMAGSRWRRHRGKPSRI